MVFKRRARGLLQPSSTCHVERGKKFDGITKVKILTWMSRTCYRKALLASSPPTRSPSPKCASRLTGDVHSGMFINFCITLLFLFFFFTISLCSDRNKPQRRYYYSLDHNDKTWTSETWAQQRPWLDVKKSTMGHSNSFLFRLHSLPHWRCISLLLSDYRTTTGGRPR